MHSYCNHHVAARLARFLLIPVMALAFLAACSSSKSTEADEDDTSAEAQTEPSGEELDVAYGTVDREHFTGAASTVDGTDALDVQPRTLADMLRGVPGVQVTEYTSGGMQVRVRGANSFLGNRDPLFVVDGVALQDASAAIYSVSPRDVDKITVLKDASSTAAYGSRGANGVILIKTKRGGS